MLEREKQKAIIEAMLFVSAQPLSVSKIVKRLGKMSDALRAHEPTDLRTHEHTSVRAHESENVENRSQESGVRSQEIEIVQSDETDPLQQLLKKQEELVQEITATDVKLLLKEIQEELQTEDHGVELVCVAQGYQMRTKLSVSALLKDDRAPTPSRLTSSSLETLAIIAYQQPVTRQKIEEVRGVDTGGVLGTLLDKTMIRVVGRSDEPGHPLIYGTSKKFLETFSLNTLKDLPTLSDYRSLQASQSQFDEAEDKPKTIQINDLIEDEWETLDVSEREVLGDLEASLKNLKNVEKDMPFLKEEGVRGEGFPPEADQPLAEGVSEVLVGGIAQEQAVVTEEKI